MAHVDHSDWMFEHSGHHLAGTHLDPQADVAADTSHLIQPDPDSVASVLKTLWHHTDLMSGGASGGQASNASANSTTSGNIVAPTLTVGSNALTVDAGGSVALPITVSSAGRHTSVTISGLASYESVTDALDHQTFSGNSITLTAAQVNSGLSLASDYAGSDHPVNTLSVTASQGVGHGAVTSAAQSIVVTDPPVVTAGPAAPTGTAAGATSASANPLTLQVSGDMLNGDPQIQVFVDGQQVGNASYDISAHHSQGQTQTIQIAGNFDPTVAHQVQVKFVNDAWDGTSAADGHDRNVYVSSISLNGMTMNGIQGMGADSSSGTAALMHSNGTFSFNVPADPPAGTGGTSASSIGIGAGAAPSGPGYYVSPTGNDSNPGTQTAPFATLARAQQAMEHSSIKATYVEGGTYHLSSAITLTAADSGETWQYYPASGVDTAVLDGGNSTAKGFDLTGASNVTINGLKFQNFVSKSIEAYSSPGTVIENNDIGFMTVAPPAGNAGAVCGISVGDHVTVKNNYVHDISSIGIASYAYTRGASNDGTVISGNVVLRTVLKSSDDGAIYINDKATGTSGGHVTISNNFVGETGGAGFTSLRVIYLDDNASNVTVTGNILGPMAAGVAKKRGNFNAVFVHNGSNNTISGNIIDLGSSSFTDIVAWGYDGGSVAGMANSTFTNNIVVSNFTGSNHVDSGYGNYAYLEAPFSNAPASWFTVNHNVYWNYASGGQVFSNGNLTNDANPIVENPQISGPTYTMAQGSPVYSSMNFSPIVGGWGPAGFVIPT